MPWLMARVYDRVMAGTEAACLRPWRRDLLANLQGRVLEVGAGTGASIPCYPDAVTELVLAEPDPDMRRQLEARVVTRDRTTVIADSVESLTRQRAEAGRCRSDRARRSPPASPLPQRVLVEI